MKFKKIFKRTIFLLLSVFVLLFSILFIYSRGYYKGSNDMYDAVDVILSDEVNVITSFDHVYYDIENPKKHVLIIPGGKVDASGYHYMAYQLAINGYEVTVFKSFFKLAILTPQYPKRFLSDDFDNVVIGHSLGGTVGSMFSSGDARITDMIFLASYPIKDVSDKHVMVITASNDQILDVEDVENSKDLLPENTQFEVVENGNHGYFGFYGMQKGDGEALISNLEQQDIVIDKMISFIE